jgi:hypothetical protein
LQSSIENPNEKSADLEAQMREQMSLYDILARRRAGNIKFPTATTAGEQYITNDYFF